MLSTHRIFLFTVALGLFAMAARHVTDPDIWWHLRTGQLILQNHAVFHSDPFSFTKFGQPWVNQEWLSEVIIALLYRAAGWSGIIVFFAAITSSSFMLVYMRSVGRPYLAGAFAIWVAFSSAPALGARPQIFSLLLASLFLVLLERSATNPKVLWYTPLLLLLWVNLHAGYAIGIAFMILFLLGDVLDIALGLETWAAVRKRFSILLASCAASLAVVPLNPYGFRMYWYPLQTVGSPAMQNYISEWMSPDFHREMYIPALLMILALLALAAVSSRRLRPTDILLLAFTLWAALHSARHVPIFALVAAPSVANLSEPWFAKMKIKQSSHERTFKNQIFKSVLNGLLLAAFLLFVFIRVGHTLRTQESAEKGAFPDAAVTFLSSADLPGPIFNDYNWGGYLIWKDPSRKVYIDGRADLYGDALMDQFAKTFQISKPGWSQTLQQWQIKTVILPPEAPVVAALRLKAQWRLIYADKQAVIMTRP